MMKRVFAGLFLSLSMMAIGCATGPVEQEKSGEEGNEEVGQATEAMVSCPERTDCLAACDSVDRVFYGKCSDDGACLCKVPIDRSGGGAGPSMACYINWNVGWGEWTCVAF